MQRQATHLVRLLVIACFSIYAISPLAGVVQGGAAPGRMGEPIRPSIGIYLVQVVLSSILNDAEEEDASSASQDNDDPDCLIKKKRAVLSARTLSSIISLASVVTVSFDRSLPGAVHAPIASEPLPRYPHLALQTLHPGNPPPTA